MKIERLEIADILLVTPARHGDPRGFFSETFRADAFADATFVQDNRLLGAMRRLMARGAPGSRMTVRPANLNSPTSLAARLNSAVA
jgi:hypothetical protein